MPERIKLKVTQVSEPKEVGQKGAKKLEFHALGPDNKELPYFTFKTSLFELIKKDAEWEADVEVKTREYQGNTYTDRQVSQIYVNGEPTAKKTGFQPRQDSPEQRRSIERQVAAKIAFEHGINEDDETHWSVAKALRQAEQIYQWISQGTIPSTPDKPQPEASKGEGGELPSGETTSHYKDIGSVLMACSKIKTEKYPDGINRAEALRIWGIKKETELSKLIPDEAWDKIIEEAN